jgi:hypothetical protein
MSLLPHHQLLLASAPRLNYAADFSGGQTASQNTEALPVIGDFDFRIEVRVNRQGSVYGNFIMGNTGLGGAYNLEGFCIYERYGEYLVYVRGIDSNGAYRGFFDPINTPDQAPIGTWVRVGYERIGDTLYALFNGQRVWAQKVGKWTIDPLVALNISTRGGGGGGVPSLHYLDWLRFDLGTGPGGTLERWLNLDFNENDNEPSRNTGLLGGQMYINAYGSTTVTHILVA